MRAEQEALTHRGTVGLVALEKITSPLVFTVLAGEELPVDLALEAQAVTAAGARAASP